MWNKIKRFIITFLLIASPFFLASKVYSATQGTLGPTSVGTLDVTIALADVVQITALDDLIFPTWPGSGSMTEFDDVCVFSNTAGGGYNITANGDGPGGAFEVDDGVNSMAYNLYWNDVAGTSTGMVLLTANSALTGQTGADTGSLDCSGGTSLTGRVIVEFLEATLMAAVVSVYSGTITLNIAPE